MYVIAAAAALVVAGSTPRPFEKRKHHASKTRTSSRASRATWDFLMLARRHEMLHEFLVETRSERPVLYDRRIVDAGEGLLIGPSSVDVDFLGSPIVRTRIVNRSDRTIDALVVATVEDASHDLSRASTWIERLAPGAAREVELFCPRALDPKSVRFSVTSL